MTKNFKLVLVLAIMVMMSMSIAFAADPITEETKSYTVTVNGNSHTSFKAIQIFSGTQDATAADDNAPLGNIVWGTDVSAKTANIIADVNAVLNPTGADALPTDAEAKIVAEKIATMNTAQAEAFGKKLDATLTGIAGTAIEVGQNKLPVGYYLIVDTSTLGNNDAKNTSLLQMTRDITITQKTDAPTVDKTLKNDGEPDTAYRDVNNMAIGDKVNYKIEAKIPDMTHYDQYYYYFTDTLSGGLTYDPASLTVKIVKESDGSVLKTLAKGTDYTTTPATAPAAGTATTIEVVLKNFIQYKAFDHDDNAETDAINLAPDYKVVVTYDATLNDKAAIGTEGNTNNVELTYSNNPNKKGNGEDKPTDEEKDDVTGKTPKDWTETYSTNLKIYKIDKDTQAKLSGVKFNIKGYKENEVVTYTETYTADNAGEYYQLKPVAPSEENTYTTKAPTALTKSLYVDDGAQKYKLEVKKNTTTEVTPISVQATTDTNGYIDVGAVLKAASVGSVAAGKYVFTEAETLAGYNLLDEAVTVVVEHAVNSKTDAEATITEATDCTWTYTVSGPAKSSEWVDAQKAYVITIENGKGTTLPETGGIGTTIFYVAGSLMVLAAAILLITKRRMGAND